MAIEKKSLVTRQPAPANKSNATRKVDISKPAASKIVAAKKPTNAFFGHHNG